MQQLRVISAQRSCAVVCIIAKLEVVYLNIIRSEVLPVFPNKKIQSLVGSKIQVEMKGNNHILEGILSSADEYLNIHLIDTVEVEDEKRIKSLGSVVLRGNNIILVNPL